MIFVDTGAFFAYAVPDDEHHQVASKWFRENRQPLITSDYVVDETLTLIRARTPGIRAIQLGGLLFSSSLAAIHYLTESDIEAAWQVFRTFTDKEWSFTDCTSKVLIEQLGITHAFSFDQHFRQFGKVAVVP